MLKIFITQKYWYLINKSEKVDWNCYDDPKAIFEYPNDMEDVCENIEEYSLGKKRKVLKVFGDMISDMINNKKRSPIVTELFIRGRKLYLLLSHILKCQKKLEKELQQIAPNH